jgi:hypothetical protein
MKFLLDFLLINLLTIEVLQGQACPYIINNERPPENEPAIYGKGDHPK